jgi:hypothetical protein
MSDLKTLEKELQYLEEQLLSPEFRHSFEKLSGLLDNDFVEFGSTGQEFDRQGIIKALMEQAPVTIKLADFKVTLLSSSVALATYRATYYIEGKPPRNSLRSSIWKNNSGKWQLFFHQGTLTA